MKSKNKMWLGAAIAGIISGMIGVTGHAADSAASKKDIEPCYGINACKGRGSCGGKGNSCAGTNACKGQGWINVEKGHCTDIQGGSLTPTDAPAKK